MSLSESKEPKKASGSNLGARHAASLSTVEVARQNFEKQRRTRNARPLRARSIRSLALLIRGSACRKERFVSSPRRDGEGHGCVSTRGVGGWGGGRWNEQRQEKRDGGESENQSFSLLLCLMMVISLFLLSEKPSMLRPPPPPLSLSLFLFREREGR